MRPASGLRPEVYRALVGAKQLCDRLGLSRLPGYGGLRRLVKRAVAQSLGELGDPSLTIKVGGARLRIPSRFTPHYLYRRYEPVTTAWSLRALKRGDRVADVGAHIGYYTVLAARRVGAAGLVHAVEPCEENLRYLRCNVEANGLANVRIHAAAAGARAGRRLLQVTESSDSHGFYAHPLATTRSTVEVAVQTLDALVGAPVRLVKIDVEGAEIDVLDGLRPLLRRTQGQMTFIVEWNPACARAAGHDPEDVVWALKDLGIQRLTVLDDHLGRPRPLEETLRDVRSRQLPVSWYVNLWGERD